MARYVILQSGFLSNENPDLILTDHEPRQSFLKAIELGKPDRRTNNPYHFHKAVQAVVNQFFNDFSQLKDFDFREKVLIATKSAFSTQSFDGWCALQNESPAFGAMQQKFLEDTLNYLVTGQRSIQIESWKPLIEAKTSPEKNVQAPLDLTRYFGQGNMLRSTELLPPKLEHAIATWTLRPDGFKDLIYSLDVIFGEVMNHRQV